MIKHIRRGLLTATAALSIAALGVAGVNAQTTANTNTNKTANGFRVSPVRSEFSIEKGKSNNLIITVENPTDIPVTAKAIVNNFVASDDETGTPRLVLDEKAPSPKNDFKSLVGVVPEVQLAARQKKDITVRISVPQDARAGGYYGAIRFAPSTSSQGSSNVGLTASVGTIVLVTVPGSLSQKVDLLQLSAAQNGHAKSFFTSGNDISVITRLKNTGDIHVKPFGRVQVKNTFGKIVESYELNNVEPRANVLPDSTRKFNNDLKNKKWFGRYTIEANIGYSQGSGDLITASAVFWYIPTWALIVLALFVLAIALGVYFLVRKLRKPAPRKL
jgi:hypothetical protein